MQVTVGGSSRRMWHRSTDCEPESVARHWVANGWVSTFGKYFLTAEQKTFPQYRKKTVFIVCLRSLPTYRRHLLLHTTVVVPFLLSYVTLICVNLILMLFSVGVFIMQFIFYFIVNFIFVAPRWATDHFHVIRGWCCRLCRWWWRWWWRGRRRDCGFRVTPNAPTFSLCLLLSRLCGLLLCKQIPDRCRFRLWWHVSSDVTFMRSTLKL